MENNSPSKRHPQRSRCSHACIRQNRLTTRDKDGHFIMIKDTLLQENITLLNVHVPTQGAKIYEELLTDYREKLTKTKP